MITYELMQKSLCHYEQNNLVLFLTRRLGEGSMTQLMVNYQIGTSKRWSGANVFWYLDQHCHPIDARVICYNAETGQQNDKSQSEWLSTLIGQQNPAVEKSVLFYGLHLLNGQPRSPVGLVEEEKTAIVCSHFLSQYVWLSASCFEESLWNGDGVDFLIHRKVVLFPSLTSFSKMKKIAEVLNAKGVTAVVSEYLEQHADEQDRRQGMSIADFLLRKVLLDQETRHLRHLSPFEQLEIMKAENPFVQELIDTFDLELVNTVEPLIRAECSRTEGACSESRTESP